MKISENWTIYHFVLQRIVFLKEIFSDTECSDDLTEHVVVNFLTNKAFVMKLFQSYVFSCVPIEFFIKNFA